MTLSNWTSRGRRTLQVATLFLAAAPMAFGAAQPVTTTTTKAHLVGHKAHLVGHMVVTATRLPSAISSVADLGAMTVTASRGAMLADLGTMTVSAHRIVVVARNDAPRAAQASL